MEKESVPEVYIGDITSEEADKAIRSLKGNKAPGLGEISAKLFQTGGGAMVTILIRLFTIC